MLSNTLYVLVFVLFFLDPALAGTLRGQTSDQERDGAISFLSSFFKHSEKTRRRGPLASKCLEDPDDPDCREGNFHGRELYYSNSHYYERPKTSTGEIYVEYRATQAPTKDQCYGNMAKYMHGKFCHSEMPSVSLEPSEQPTYFADGPDGDRTSEPETTDNPSDGPTVDPPGVPTIAVTSIPTTVPSVRPPSNTRPSPSSSPMIITPVPSSSLTTPRPTPAKPTLIPSVAPIMMTSAPVSGYEDDDDDSTHQEDPDGTKPPTKSPIIRQPTKQPSPAPTFDEEDCPAFLSNTDIMSYPDSPLGDFFRIKLYWEEGYYWQEEDFERPWCLRCKDNFNCKEGEKLYLGYCGKWSKSAFFKFFPVDGGSKVQIVMKNLFDDPLCIERNHRQIRLQKCDFSNEFQHWIVGTSDVRRFEIIQNVGGVQWCLSNHHHPKCGEEVEIFRCSQVQGWSTGLWNKLYY